MRVFKKLCRKMKLEAVYLGAKVFWTLCTDLLTGIFYEISLKSPLYNWMLCIFTWCFWKHKLGRLWTPRLLPRHGEERTGGEPRMLDPWEAPWSPVGDWMSERWGELGLGSRWCCWPRALGDCTGRSPWVGIVGSPALEAVWWVVAGHLAAQRLGHRQQGQASSNMFFIASGVGHVRSGTETELFVYQEEGPTH